MLTACGGSGTGADGGAGGVDGAAIVVDGAPSGRLCSIGQDAAGLGTVIASPALECPSRTCLHVAGATTDQCTARCEDAEDCVASAESACAAGFTCQAVVAAGPFACETFCVCADRVPPAPACARK